MKVENLLYLFYTDLYKECEFYGKSIRSQW